MDFGGYFRERKFYESPVAVAAYRGMRRALAGAGFDVVLKTFYSPIPDLKGLPRGFFEDPVPLPGIDLALDRQLSLVDEQLSGLMGEFQPSDSPDPGPHRYTTANPSYSRLDATFLYAMVRHLRPRRTIELGSGYSTLVTAEAGRRNANEGFPLSLEVYDPYAAVVDASLPGLDALHSVAVQQVPTATFEALEAGDVLFVDTTHTVKANSDVNYIVLQVLPRLKPGVVVHIHDIFLPFEYPRDFADKYGLYWNEQYLVQGFLAMNPGYEVVLSGSALTRLRTADFCARVPAGVPAEGSGAFWIRRTGAAAG